MGLTYFFHRMKSTYSSVDSNVLPFFFCSLLKKKKSTYSQELCMNLRNIASNAHWGYLFLIIIASSSIPFSVWQWSPVRPSSIRTSVAWNGRKNLIARKFTALLHDISWTTLLWEFNAIGATLGPIDQLSALCLLEPGLCSVRTSNITIRIARWVTTGARMPVIFQWNSTFAQMQEYPSTNGLSVDRRWGSSNSISW